MLCFVQPSQEDDRLTKFQKDKFPITSCCMQTENEIDLWLKSANSKILILSKAAERWKIKIGLDKFCDYLSKN